jgi:hypothetical protein
VLREGTSANQSKRTHLNAPPSGIGCHAAGCCISITAPLVLDHTPDPFLRQLRFVFRKNRQCLSAIPKCLGDDYVVHHGKRVSVGLFGKRPCEASRQV